jgi:hypothetical protein
MGNALKESMYHVLWPISDPASRRCATRALASDWLVFAFALSLMVIPATALDEPRPPHQIAYGQYHAPEALVGLCTAAIVLFADRIIAYSSLLIGPSMGVTSVLWLMMRNDGAISPGSSWM